MGRHKKLLKLENMEKANNLLLERQLLKEAPGMPLWKICGPNEAGGFSHASSMGGIPAGMVVSFFVSASTSWYSTAPLTPAGTINTDPFSPTTNLIDSAGVNHATAGDVMAMIDEVPAGGCVGFSIQVPSVADPDFAGVSFSGFQTFCAEFLGYGDMMASGAWPLIYPPGTQISTGWSSQGSYAGQSAAGAPDPIPGEYNIGNCECCNYTPHTDPHSNDHDALEDPDANKKTKHKIPTNPTQKRKKDDEEQLKEEIRRYKRLF